MKVEFIVLGVPVEQPRHRVNHATRRLFIPDNHPVHAYKGAIHVAAREAFREEPMLGPVFIKIQFAFPRPASHVWKKKRMLAYPHVKKPDIDNLSKAVLDALNGLCYLDDSQVCMLEAYKIVTSGEEDSHTHITIAGKNRLPGGT